MTETEQTTETAGALEQSAAMLRRSQVLSSLERQKRAERLAAGRILLAALEPECGLLAALDSAARLAAEQRSADAGAAMAIAADSLARSAGGWLRDSLEQRSESLTDWLAEAERLAVRRAGARGAERARLRRLSVSGAPAGSRMAEAEAEASAEVRSVGAGWLSKCAKRSASAAAEADSRQSGARLAALAVGLQAEQSESEPESERAALLRLSSQQRRRLQAASRASALAPADADSLERAADSAEALCAGAPLCWSAAGWLRFASALAVLRPIRAALMQADAIAASRRAPAGFAPALAYIRPERRSSGIGGTEPDAGASLLRSARSVGLWLAADRLQALSPNLPTEQQRSGWLALLQASEARSLLLADWLTSDSSAPLPGAPETADSERGAYRSEALRLIRSSASSAAPGSLRRERSLQVSKLARKSGASSRAETEALRRALRCQRCHREQQSALLSVRLEQRAAALAALALEQRSALERLSAHTVRLSASAASEPVCWLSLLQRCAASEAEQQSAALRLERAAAALQATEQASQRLTERLAALREAEPLAADYWLSAPARCDRCAAGTLQGDSERLSALLLSSEAPRGWLSLLEPEQRSAAPAGDWHSGSSARTLTLRQQRSEAERQRRQRRYWLALRWSAAAAADSLASAAGAGWLAALQAGALLQRPALLQALPASSSEPASVRLWRLSLEQRTAASAARWLARVRLEQSAASEALQARSAALAALCAASAGQQPEPEPEQQSSAPALFGSSAKAGRLSAALDAGERAGQPATLTVRLRRWSASADNESERGGAGASLAGVKVLEREALRLSLRQRWSENVRGSALQRSEPVPEPAPPAPLRQQGAPVSLWRWLAPLLLAVSLEQRSAALQAEPLT